MAELIRHPYKYFPYELELAKREAAALFHGASFTDTPKGLATQVHLDADQVRRLVYFAGVQDGDLYKPTMQSQLEQLNGAKHKRQSTRYSSHGLHEYKGKFNPQIVRAILNILDIPTHSRVFDPFCGSGTSLLECAHMGMNATGTDINPLAVFLANAKLEALRTPAKILREELARVLAASGRVEFKSKCAGREREEYLLGWFTPGIYREIEILRSAIESVDITAPSCLLAIASNLLRDYSLQDPVDLRIRRRKSPLPEKPFMSAYEEAANIFIDKLEATQYVVGSVSSDNRAVLADSRSLSSSTLAGGGKFDCALTSPPYATALPYIDTQRLSLVWLGLIPAAEIVPLESRLVGSREVRGKQSKQALFEQLHSNSAELPQEQADYCLMLQRSLRDTDGFRRQAVPLLLYRYFDGMRRVFASLLPLMSAGAPFALIVGGNHTVLGGTRFDIDTPYHLAELARSAGWEHSESLKLQTYQRYGYHMENAVTAEAMVIVRAR